MFGWAFGIDILLFFDYRIILSIFYILHFDICYCAQNNIGNIIQYHSIRIISIIQCRFNITRWVSTVLSS